MLYEVCDGGSSCSEGNQKRGKKVKQGTHLLLVPLPECKQNVGGGDVFRFVLA